MPHQLFIRHPVLCVVAVAASLLISLWAIYVDPVINFDGILYIDAARHFAAGRWDQALAVHKWPFYAIVISTISSVAGLTVTHSAYLVNAALYALLVLGFVSVIRSLDGSRTALWLAAVVALLHPTFNEFRAFIIRDAGYWAFYLWSLAYLFSYIRHRHRYLLALSICMGTAAFLFRVEGFVLLIVLLVCPFVDRSGRRAGRGTILAVAAGVVAIVAVSFPLWQYSSESGIAIGSLLANPLDNLASSWQAISLDITHRLQALGREFPVSLIPALTFLVYVTTAATMLVSQTIVSLGIVSAGLVVYALVRGGALVDGDTRIWWWTLIAAQGLLIIGFAFSNFFLADRYCVALAITLLIAVPLLLDNLWSSLRRSDGRHKVWVPVIAVLLLIEAAEGLDVSTDKQYLRDAGLWLRANAPPQSTIYANNQILLHYSGLKEARPRSDYSWKAAMAEVWTGSWRRYDYFVLVMSKAQARSEVLLFRQLEAETLKEFRSEQGERVLIFRGAED